MPKGEINQAENKEETSSEQQQDPDLDILKLKNQVQSIVNTLDPESTEDPQTTELDTFTEQEKPSP